MDFGKVCFTPTHTHTNLAAWVWLPPEIEKNRENRYNQKIDSWLLAVALIYVWFPMANKIGPPRVKSNHTEMCRRLAEERNSGLNQLLTVMLSWNPTDRPTAKEALQDPCFRNINSNHLRI